MNTHSDKPMNGVARGLRCWGKQDDIFEGPWRRDPRNRPSGK